MKPAESVTQLLVKWGDGDQQALDMLMPLVYSELRRLASNYLRRERLGHTLQPTALVNEAYLKLVDQKGARWQNRAQFYGVAAQLMRRIQPVDGGPPRQVTDFTDRLMSGFAWSPDGKNLVCTRGIQLRDAILITDATK